MSKKPDNSVGLIESCNGILWLNEKKALSQEQKVEQSKKHIMISYNRESRDLCISIEKRLEESNYKVWIDVNDIHGNSLECILVRNLT